MIFKRFSLQKKNPEFSDICEQEILKSNFFNNNKNFQNALLEYGIYILSLVISFLLHKNLIPDNYSYFNRLNYFTFVALLFSLSLWIVDILR